MACQTILYKRFCKGNWLVKLAAPLLMVTYITRSHITLRRLMLDIKSPNTSLSSLQKLKMCGLQDWTGLWCYGCSYCSSQLLTSGLARSGIDSWLHHTLTGLRTADLANLSRLSGSVAEKRRVCLGRRLLVAAVKICTEWSWSETKPLCSLHNTQTQTHLPQVLLHRPLQEPVSLVHSKVRQGAQSQLSSLT